MLLPPDPPRAALVPPSCRTKLLGNFKEQRQLRQRQRQRQRQKTTTLLRRKNGRVGFAAGILGHFFLVFRKTTTREMTKFTVLVTT